MKAPVLSLGLKTQVFLMLPELKSTSQGVQLTVSDSSGVVAHILVMGLKLVVFCDI